MNAPPVFVAAAQDSATRLLEAIECPPGHPEDLLPRSPQTASPAAGFYTYRTLFLELRFAAACQELCRSAGRFSVFSSVIARRTRSWCGKKSHTSAFDDISKGECIESSGTPKSITSMSSL
jgi:hypothetical protein